MPSFGLEKEKKRKRGGGKSVDHPDIFFVNLHSSSASLSTKKKGGRGGARGERGGREEK